MSKTGPGTLKCIISGAAVREAVLAALREHVSVENIRAAVAEAVLVLTTLEPSELRDRLSHAVEPGEWLFVVEFEKWSGYGEDIDREWLLARGH